MSLEGFWEKVNETTPKALSGMSLEQLHEYYDYFALANRKVGNADDIRATKERLDLLQRTIENKRLSTQSNQQHIENRTLGQKTLFWAQVGGVAAVIGTVVLLWKDTPLSRLPPSTSSLSSPTSSPQASASAAPSPAPTAAESPSESPQASETPAVTATPE